MDGERQVSWRPVFWCIFPAKSYHPAVSPMGLFNGSFGMDLFGGHFPLQYWSYWRIVCELYACLGGYTTLSDVGLAYGTQKHKKNTLGWWGLWNRRFYQNPGPSKYLMDKHQFRLPLEIQSTKFCDTFLLIKGNQQSQINWNDWNDCWTFLHFCEFIVHLSATNDPKLVTLIDAVWCTGQMGMNRDEYQRRCFVEFNLSIQPKNRSGNFGRWIIFSTSRWISKMLNVGPLWVEHNERTDSKKGTQQWFLIFPDWSCWWIQTAHAGMELYHILC